MKFKNNIFLVSILFAQAANGAEECPVNKISQALGLECESYELIKKMSAANADNQIDAICLKLGRVSAILRRTQGQLAGRPETPIPPSIWKQRAIEIEGFCGGGASTTLPRGLTNKDYIVREDGFNIYRRDQIQESFKWILKNKDPQGCPTPVTLSKERSAFCLE